MSESGNVWENDPCGRDIPSFRPVQAFFRAPGTVCLELLFFHEPAALGILIEKLLEVRARMDFHGAGRGIGMLDLCGAGSAGKLRGQGGELRVDEDQCSQDQHQRGGRDITEKRDGERKRWFEGGRWHGVGLSYGGGDLPVEELGAENLAGFRGFRAAENGAVLGEGDGKAALEGRLRAEGAEHGFQALELLGIPGNALRDEV